MKLLSFGVRFWCASVFSGTRRGKRSGVFRTGRSKRARSLSPRSVSRVHGDERP